MRAPSRTAGRPAFAIGGVRLPAAPEVTDPTPAAVRTAVLTYAAEHATPANIRPGVLAVALLDRLAVEHRLAPGPVDPRNPTGRWTSRPPAPWLADLRDSVAAIADGRPEPEPLAPPEPIVPTAAPSTPAPEPLPEPGIPSGLSSAAHYALWQAERRGAPLGEPVPFEAGGRRYTVTSRKRFDGAMATTIRYADEPAPF